MAIDTEDKRRSATALWGGPRVLPVADSTVDAGDRAHLSIYRGLFDTAGDTLEVAGLVSVESFGVGSVPGVQLLPSAGPAMGGVMSGVL